MSRLRVMSSAVVGLALLAAACGGSAPEIVELHGAGASFPAPLYDRWFKEYVAAHPNTRVDYQSVGSGAGITQFTNKTVDFGASDAAMTDDEIAKVDRGVQLIPMTAGSVVLAYNLPDLKAPLQLSRAAYTGIFLGKITKWNDAAIAASNPGVKLPATAVTVVRRADTWWSLVTRPRSSTTPSRSTHRNTCAASSASPHATRGAIRAAAGSAG